MYDYGIGDSKDGTFKRQVPKATCKDFHISTNTFLKKTPLTYLVDFEKLKVPKIVQPWKWK